MPSAGVVEALDVVDDIWLFTMDLGPIDLTAGLLEEDKPEAAWPFVWWVLVTAYPNDLLTFDN